MGSRSRRGIVSRIGMWECIDGPGHDAVRITRGGGGWTIQGMSVFAHRNAPACLTYVIELHADWSTREGRIDGFLARRTISHRIARNPSGRTLDGGRVPGLAHLVDLDLGFTPATNMVQLRRVPLADAPGTYVHQR